MAIWNAAIPAGLTPQELVMFLRQWIRLDLPGHESSSPPGRPGGHCIHWHTKKSDAEIDARFDLPTFGGNMNSAFNHDVDFAETLIIKAILDDIDKVYHWYHQPLPKPNLIIKVTDNSFVVGRAVRRSSRGHAFDVNNYKVVLSTADFIDETVDFNGHTRIVLTAHPIS